MVTLYFSPQEFGKIKTTAYCEVSGRLERLPLTLNGFGKGPQVRIHLDSLDLKECLVHTVHCFEIVFHNIGIR